MMTYSSAKEEEKNDNDNDEATETACDEVFIEVEYFVQNVTIVESRALVK